MGRINNVFVGLIFGFIIGLACDLPRYFFEMDEEIDTHQIVIDSLEDIIKASIDTIQYESIDTTKVYWPWGREEFYYFKYKEN
jgi:hypothetical protein